MFNSKRKPPKRHGKTRAERKQKEAAIKAEKMNNFDLDETLSRFIMDEPFYAHISSNTDKIKTDKLDTAGVTVEDGNFVMYYNEDFFKELNWMQKQGLLIHEFLHLIFNHVTSRIKHDKNGKIDKAWFLAADFAINSLIQENRLPPGGLMPGKWNEITNRKLFDKEYLKSYDRVKDAVRRWPKGESSDWYFNEINKDREAFDLVMEEPNNEYGLVDDHTGWEDLSSEEKEILTDKIQSVMGDAVDICQKNNKWGSVPMDLQQAIRKILEGNIDWTTLLRNFVGNSLTVHRNSTIKKINRRYPYIHPGKRRHRTARIVVCVDQSGSVSKKELQKFFGEMDSLAEFTEFVVVPFDARVVTSGIFTWERGQRLDPKRVACGGTNFDIPTEWVNDRFSEYDAAIFMTDGGCSKPRDCKIPRAWILCKGSEMNFKTNEIVIKMN